MPNISDITIPQLMSVTELRTAIGDPTSDPTAEVGSVSDSALQELINREEQALNDAFEQKVITTDFDTLPDFTVEAVDVSVSTSSQDNSNLAQGDVDLNNYYPLSKKCITSDGRELAYDPQIDQTARTLDFISKHRYFLDSETVYVLPSSLTSVTIFLPPLGDLFNSIMGGEVANANDRLIQKGKQLVEARSRQGQILETSSLNEEGFEN